MRIRQGLILLLIVCIVVAEVSAGKQKRESGKNGKNEKGKNEKKEKGGKYEGKEGKHSKHEHKHGGKHKEEAVNEENVEEEGKVEEEVVETVEDNIKTEEVKEKKGSKKAGKEGKVKDSGKKSKKSEKEAASGSCDCPPGPAGPPGPPGPPGECIYQPVCPETLAKQESCLANPDSCGDAPVNSEPSCASKETCTTDAPSECPCKACNADCPCKKGVSHVFVTKSSGVIAIHSQNTLVPECPLGQNKLWEGFSLLNIETNGQSSDFDLGSTSSCVKTFTSTLSATCDIEGQCTTGQRNDRSYWLLANGTLGSEAVTEEVAQNLVSRCVVCDVPSTVVAIHSQSTEVPKCPDGWDDLWFGYSYLDSNLGEQSLTKPGSCLKELKNPLFIECNPAKSSCNLLETHKSSWLVAQKPQVVKEGVETTPAAPVVKISRCSVCIKVA